MPAIEPSRQPFSRQVTILLMALAAAVSCAQDLGDLGQFPCGTDGSCPDGYSCNAGQLCIPTPSCHSGETPCSGRCVNTNYDTDHCGSCGHTCDGTSCCSGSCVNTASDSKNCGSCGKSCPAGGVCSKGACSCSGGRTSCGDSCVDLTSDKSNCGACGTSCKSSQQCASSKCSCPSTTPTTCSGECVNLDSDSSNCGACAASCGSVFPHATGVCAAKTCKFGACSSGYADCNNNTSDGCEASTSSDVNNCGSCGHPCSSGLACKSGVCSGSVACKETCVTDTQCYPNVCEQTNQGMKCLPLKCRECFDKPGYHTCYSDPKTCLYDRCEVGDGG